MSYATKFENFMSTPRPAHQIATPPPTLLERVRLRYWQARFLANRLADRARRTLKIDYDRSRFEAEAMMVWPASKSARELYCQPAPEWPYDGGGNHVGRP